MSNFLGVWLFTAMFYQGQVIPPMNPHLKIFFTFQSEKRNELYYYRDNESGFCRRWANYKIENNQLVQTITEVDPENHISCTSDTDMQLGNTSVVSYDLVGNELRLHLMLGEEPLDYIFTKQTVE